MYCVQIAVLVFLAQYYACILHSHLRQNKTKVFYRVEDWDPKHAEKMAPKARLGAMAEFDVPQVLDYHRRTAFDDGNEAPGDPGPAAEAGAGSRRYRHPAGNVRGIRCGLIHASERHREQHGQIQVRPGRQTRHFLARSVHSGGVRH